MASTEAEEPAVNLEDYEESSALPQYLANPQPRLKKALDFQNLLTNRSATFELEDDDEEQLFEDGNISNDFNENAYYLREYLNNPSQQKEEITNSVTVEEALGDFEELTKTMTDITEDGNVKKLIVRKGNGKAVPSDGKVFFNYIAFAEGKDEPFDSSIQRGVIESIMLNRDECLQGLEIGIKTMELREISKFWIHYDYCYGKLGVPPRIPAASHCVFTVEIVEAVDPEKLKNIHKMSPADRLKLTFDQVYEGAIEKRDMGAELYHRVKYLEAVRSYVRAVDYLESYPTADQDEDKKRTDLLYTLFSNIAECYLKANIPSKACTACRKALKLPNHELAYKVYYKFARAKFIFRDYDVARELCERAIKLAPRDIYEITSFLSKIKAAIKQDDKDLSPMYRNMFISKSKESGGGDACPSESQK